MLRDKQHPAEIPLADLLLQCKVKRTRGSGPGGQHRNKVETAIVIEHLPTGIIGQASERRSQERNREIALGRLRVNLAIAIRTDSNRNKMSDRWKERTSGGRLRVNEQHFDYAAILSETLDLLLEHDYDLHKVAKVAGISASQLAKFIKTSPAALQSTNQQREALGLFRIR